MSGPDLGPLASLVGTIGSLVAASGAIALTWRGRANWEPSETDVPKGPERVGGAVTAVLVSLLWVVTRSADSRGFVPILALTTAGLLVVGLLVYSFIIATQTYEIESPFPEDPVATRKIIGGFALTAKAREATASGDPTVQEYFKGTGFAVDAVWPRTSRALAKVTFVAVYLVIVVAGSVALASAAILVEPYV